MLTLAWAMFFITCAIALIFGALYWFGLSRTLLEKEAIATNIAVYTVGAGLILWLMLVLPL